MSALGAAIIAGSLVFAASAQEAPTTFTARCTNCHSVQQIGTKLAARPKDTREEFLKGFLGRHFAPPEADRPAIIAYLIANTPA
jgi:cytochrome c2